MEILAIIPARSGSKGIKDKNIKNFCGQPLITYTIESSIRSKYIKKTIVSTDCENIAFISRNKGAYIPFLRPKYLSTDESKSIDVVKHTLQWLSENESYFPDLVCLLQCTSPLRETKHIDEAIETILDLKGDTLVSMCKSKTNPYLLRKIVNNQIEKVIKDNNEFYRRQDMPDFYEFNGAIYLFKPEILYEKNILYDKNSIPFIMDKVCSVDIDDITDFEFAEFIYKKSKNKII